MAARIRCWTCKERKISCDRATPACLNCSRSNRQCGGYGLRLSWPRWNDRKRAIVYISSRHSSTSTMHHDLQWINASSADIYLHHIASGITNHMCDREKLMQLFPPCVPEPMRGTPANINRSDHDLLQYFERIGSNTLPMFDSSRTRVRQILMRMALADSTLASTAVLQSILALTSLYKEGLQPHAARLKIAALQTLITSAKNGIDAEAGIQHVAAEILLSCFEINLDSDGVTWNSSWVGHLCGAKEVIKAVKGGEHPLGSDSSIVLGWVYYYDVLARFSLRHWRTRLVSQTIPDLSFNSNGDVSCDIQYLFVQASFAAAIPHISDHAHELLRLLNEVCDTILYPWDPQYHSIEYREYLNGLESRLTNVTLTRSASSPVVEDLIPVLELFRLAGLIYLERASKNFSGLCAKLEHWIDKAFLMFKKLEACRYPFLLFIIGCEARTDDRRRVILDLISKTQQDPHVRNMKEARVLVQTAWVQDDLEVEGEVEYIRKVNLVMSSFSAVPFLV